MRDLFAKFGTYLFRPVLLARLFFILLTIRLAFRLAEEMIPKRDPMLFSALGLVAAVVIVVVEYATNAVSSKRLLMAAFGCFMGLVFGTLLYPTIPARLVDPETSRFICLMMFGYFGIVLGLRHSDWLRPGNLKFLLVNPVDRPKVLDSSVIIDGRIVEVNALGLLAGPIVVPNFVLLEIQGIADSSDASRRARGRRGLEVLDRLRRTCKTLDIIDTDFPDQPDVDQKLVQLCRTMSGELVTNDYNLQKIAELHQIHVVNFNELADALRPNVYVGETLEVAIVKSGREPGQGVAYLEDGTMIVVEAAEALIGRDCQIVVSNILQNPSGRLIFARIREDESRRMHA